MVSKAQLLAGLYVTQQLEEDRVAVDYLPEIGFRGVIGEGGNSAGDEQVIAGAELVSSAKAVCPSDAESRPTRTPITSSRSRPSKGREQTVLDQRRESLTARGRSDRHVRQETLRVLTFRNSAGR